jgi:hypothetical protein
MSEEYQILSKYPLIKEEKEGINPPKSLFLRGF